MKRCDVCGSRSPAATSFLTYLVDNKLYCHAYCSGKDGDDFYVCERCLDGDEVQTRSRNFMGPRRPKTRRELRCPECGEWDRIRVT